jgi:hypothetical protein
MTHLESYVGIPKTAKRLSQDVSLVIVVDVVQKWISRSNPLRINESVADVDVEASVQRASTQAEETCRVPSMKAIRKRSHITAGHCLWKKVYKSFQISD